MAWTITTAVVVVFCHPCSAPLRRSLLERDHPNYIGSRHHRRRPCATLISLPTSGAQHLRHMIRITGRHIPTLINPIIQISSTTHHPPPHPPEIMSLIISRPPTAILMERTTIPFQGAMMAIITSITAQRDRHHQLSVLVGRTLPRRWHTSRYRSIYKLP